MKKILSFLLAFSMVLSYVPMPTLAAENGLCAHHVKHDANCGYVAAVEGSDCNHQCTESCTRKDVTLCVHDHAAVGCIHTEAAEAVACDHVHDDSCNYNEAEDTCDHQHGECAYKPAVKESWSCGHVCTVDTGCVKAVCAHEHNADCGFVQAVEGKECTFVCEACKAEEEKVCTCESTDPGEHAPFCDLYVRTYEECKCVLSCAVEGLNEWCETCYFEGVASCNGGEDEASAYLTDTDYTITNGKLVIHDGVTTIGNNAFCQNTVITSVEIPASVTKIGNYAFYGCSNLITVAYDGMAEPTAGSYVFGGTGVSNVEVPANYIGDTFCGLPVFRNNPAESTTYTVTVTTDGNGTASADPASAAEGAEVTLTATPNEGYRFKEWRVVSGGVTITDNKFTMGNTNVEIKAIFAPIHEHSWTYSVNEAKDTITATCGAADCTVNGGKATITLTAPADLTYSGTAKTVTVVQSPENTFSLPELSLTGDQTSAGNHSASLIMGDAMATVSYTIAKRSITITADNQTIAYGGALTEKDVTITGDGLASGETLDSVTLTPSTTNVTINGTITPSNAVIKNGDKDVTANYSIDYVNGTLIINKAQTPEVPIPTVSDIYYGQALSDAQLTENWQWKDGSFVPLAGDQYPAVLSVDDVNYDYTGVEGYDSQTHTVTRNIQVMVYKATPVITVTAVPSSAAPEKTVTVTASIVNPYNANMTELLPELTLTYKIGDGEPQTITGNSFTIPRGTAENTVITITAAAADNGKYIDASETTEVTVTAKLPQTITAPTAGITVTYGQPVFALGAEASHGELSYNVNPTDVVSIDPDGNITVHKAGNATITVSAAETDEYAPASVTVPITVNRATLTITAENKTAVVGAAMPALTYTVTGLVGNDALTTAPTLTCNTDMNTAGAFDIVPSGAIAGDNYTINYVNGKLTVKKEYKVTVADTTNGTVTVSAAKATEGTQIIVTVTPKSSWYKLKTLVVTNASGTSITVTNAGDGKYAFTMPESDVTVTATFGAKVTSIADPTNPKTGDDFYLALWSGMAMTSLLGAAALLLNKKKFYQR